MTVVRTPPRSLLVERAEEYLKAGPAPAVDLIAHVCRLGGVPGMVADEMAYAMLGGRRDFVRESDGRWALSQAGVPRLASSLGALDRSLGMLPPAVPLPDVAGLPYVVVDVETTGGCSSGSDRITEVAAVVVRDGQVADAWETLVNPMRPIPPWITALTNISWSMVKDAPTFCEIAPKLLDLLEGRIFVAHNATFDWNFICREVERATGERLDGERVCTVRLARRLLPQLRRRSLDHVCLHYGVDITARHRAGGDALATAHVFLRLLRDARHRGITYWDDLRLLLDRRTGRRKRKRRRSLPHPVDRDTTA